MRSEAPEKHARSFFFSFVVGGVPEPATEYLYYSTIIQEYAAWKLQTPIKKNSELNFGG